MQEYKTHEQKRKFYDSYKWRKVRKQVLMRDNYECQWCKEEGKVTTDNLEVDHIKEIEFHPDLALDTKNMRVLCKYHHNVRHDRFDGKETKEKRWDDEKW